MNSLKYIYSQVLIASSLAVFQIPAFADTISFDSANEIRGRVVGPITSGQAEDWMDGTQIKAYYLETERPMLLNDPKSSCGAQRIERLPILSEGMARYKNKYVKISASIQCVESKLGSYAIDRVDAIEDSTSSALPPMVANLPNVSCNRPKRGWNQECASDGWRILIDAKGCSAKKGAYGKVQADGEATVKLRRSLPPAQSDVEAKLGDGQFVCVAATARESTSNQPQWYYLMAIPVQSVKACAAKSFCARPGDLPIEWMRPTSGQRCHANARSRYEGDCAAGWVKAEEFGEFSMGL
ncbi:hypothetical protein [Pseudoxanthomonas sp. CF125]|uniref:hypothetical protein n=1 Tax=Pseudoxanthomonas sp. CF125 TaxID=1855303 RepID=UPI0008851385|nr:hypothetical protein [Pseudoxanthomonas sp. CF125]SDR13890.1 hypothetical protein SAMN05216569_3292 [Pseudoxanthomonas sp. CF125]